MRILHEFLFYLIYHYKGVYNEDNTENETYIKEFCEELKNEEIPKSYLKEISWKMFIPPLMKYEGILYTLFYISLPYIQL